MKIVIAPDSFKESLTAYEASEAIASGMRRVWPEEEYLLIPMADGGEGTVQSVVDAIGGELHETEVQGPMGEPVLARFAYVKEKKSAVIEMAEASGLPLVPEDERNPEQASSYGTGELIKAALDLGCEKIIVALGGSATNDGGIGALAALGVIFYDEQGSELVTHGHTTKAIAKVDTSGMDSRIANCDFLLACDVTNPLLGKNGATYIYGKQKGASQKQLDELELGMENWARFLPEAAVEIPGSGAAGGLGAGLLAYCGGRIASGVELIAELVQLDEKLVGADLVITGEGAVNHQTPFGKTPVGVAARAKCPVVILAGVLQEGYKSVYEHGIEVCWPIEPGPCSSGEAIRSARQYLSDSSERLARTLNIGKAL